MSGKETDMERKINGEEREGDKEGMRQQERKADKCRGTRERDGHTNRQTDRAGVWDRKRGKGRWTESETD